MVVGTEMEDAVALIVADDLTGACDSGVHFAVRGLRTQVAIRAEHHGRCDAPVVACNTHTRSSAALEVPGRLASVLELDRERRPKIRMKKIDSTLRGPVEREIDWLLKQLGLPMAVLAAAFPGAGRVVRDGRVKIAGSEFAVDIAACFPRMKSAHVRRSEIGVLGERIAEEIERGTKVLIVDAEDEVDLQRIAGAERLGTEVLWAGSGGLARALAAEVGGESVQTDRPEACGPVLLCAGSDHCVTVEQIQRLEQELDVVRLRADEAGAAGARRALASGANVVLEFAREQIDGPADAALGAKMGVGHCGALILTGGDTAMHVLQSLGARTLELRHEVEPGIPWGRIEGGEADGKAVVTKSGGFGGRDSLIACVDWLRPGAARRQKAEAL